MPPDVPDVERRASSPVQRGRGRARTRPALHQPRLSVNNAPPAVSKNLLCRARQRRRMSVLEEALLVRPQVPATRIPGFWCRTEKRVREAAAAEKRKHFRTASDEHARNTNRPPRYRMR